MIPVSGFKEEVRKWLSNQGATVLDPQPCFVFSEASFESGDTGLADYFTSGAWISWLGGPGISGVDWPHNAAGKPLAHVASFCLSEAQPHPEMAASWGNYPSLPEGFLEIYHDLETYGSEAEDAENAGWLVRYIPSTKGLDLVYPSNIPEPISGEECQQGLLMPGFTLPAYPDIYSASGVAFEVWEHCFEDLQATWHEQRFSEKTDYAVPFTHLGGHSWNGKTGFEELLNTVLPISDYDTHVLLATVESWTTLNGWFSDAGNLEVWLRQSDLKKLDFSHVWCLIRTD